MMTGLLLVGEHEHVTHGTVEMMDFLVHCTWCGVFFTWEPYNPSAGVEVARKTDAQIDCMGCLAWEPS